MGEVKKMITLIRSTITIPESLFISIGNIFLCFENIFLKRKLNRMRKDFVKKWGVEPSGNK